MKIVSRKGKGIKDAGDSIDIITNDVMEFIHIYNASDVRIGMLTLFNSVSGDTKVTYKQV